MKLVYKRGDVEIYEVKAPNSNDVEYYVYGAGRYLNGEPRVCPSLGMAMECAS
jgi:hypothetical protein